MNKSPLNYLLMIVSGTILWVITAVFYAGTFTESLTLAVSAPEDVLPNLQIMLAIVALIGIAGCAYWFYYGNLDSTAGDLTKAKRVWWILFVLQITASAVSLFVFVYMNLKEGISATDWLIVFVLLSLHTWIFFWLCTYLMSPRTVKYIPLFK